MLSNPSCMVIVESIIIMAVLTLLVINEGGVKSDQ